MKQLYEDVTNIPIIEYIEKIIGIFEYHLNYQTNSNFLFWNGETRSTFLDNMQNFPVERYSTRVKEKKKKKRTNPNSIANIT